MTLRATGNEGTFEFAYPDGTAGAFTVDIKTDTAKGRVTIKPLEWLDQPAGFRMIGLNGQFSDDGKRIAGRTTGGCGKFTMTNPDATTLAPEPVAEAEPVVEPERPTSVGDRPENSPPIPSVWESELACHRLKSIRLTFQEPDADGYDVLVRVLEPKAVEYTTLRARSFPGRNNFGLAIEAEPAASGSLNRNPMVLTTSPIIWPPNQLSVNIRSPNCGEARLLPAKEDPPAAKPELPKELAALVGAWDGVAYFRRSDEAVPVALTIRASESLVEGRYLDADMVVDGVVQPSALFGDGERIELKPLNRSARTYDAGLYPRLKDGGAGGDLMTGFLLDREPLHMFLWRRPPGMEISLKERCDNDLQPWFDRGMASVVAARSLRTEFYPKLQGYDIDEATAREAKANAEGVGSGADFATFVLQCALTAEDFSRLPGGGALGSVIDADEMLKRRIAMADSGTDQAARLPAGATVSSAIVADLEAAEASLQAAIAALPAAQSVDGLLADVDALTPLIAASRPTVAARLLQPVIVDLQRLDRQSSETAGADRARRARERMAGLTPPVLSDARRSALILAVSEGRQTSFSQDEIGFLGGMVGQSVESCAAPSGATLASLTGLLAQGVMLGLGTEYANPDLMKSWTSPLQQTANTIAGGDLVKRIGCGDPWLAGFFDVLAMATEDRYVAAGGRAPLFERSCALVHGAGSCSCLMTALEPVMPGVGKRDYDRSMIEAALNANPLVMGPTLMQCGIGNY